MTVALHNDEGIGAHSDVDANGLYTVSVPHGAYKMNLRVASRIYAEPQLPLVHVRPITATVVPTITLLARDAIISGTLTDGASALVAGVPVVVWNPDTHAAFNARSGPDGVYDVAVYSGTWNARPAPLPAQPYIYTGTAASVSAISNSSNGNVNFVLANASATIHGALLDEAGALLSDATGWAQARAVDGSIGNGAPMHGGEFDVLVPTGAYSVTLRLPNGYKFLWDGDAVGANAPGNISMTLVKKDALIYGAQVEGRPTQINELAAFLAEP